MSMRCHDIYDKEVGRVHIPGCMGCAVYGHKAGCTCPAKPKHDATAERLDALEANVREILALLRAPKGDDRG